MASSSDPGRETSANVVRDLFRAGLEVARVLLYAAALLATVAFGFAAVSFYAIRSVELPELGRLADYRPPLATQVLARDGTVLGEFFVERRYYVPIERIPLVVRRAFLAAEDEDFYRHPGVDLAGILRAAWHNLTSGGSLQGGSTITQQVVKSILLSPRRSYRRKLKEILLALRLESAFEKDEILELYLNHIYLGAGAYGVAAASLRYFGRPVEDLGLAEAALLAGLPQAPSRYSPLSHWPRAKARQRYVLRRMVEAGFVTEEEAARAARKPLVFAPPRGRLFAAPYYVDEVRRILEARYGSKRLYEGGWRVYTAADLRLVEAAEKALRAGLEELHRRHGGKEGSEPEVEGALVALEVGSGAVLALVGGYDYRRSPFDRATQALRQPGSAFKPFVYSAAFERGSSPASVVVDEPVAFRDGDHWWMPQNYDEEFLGPITLREALTFSRNVPTVKLARRVGIGTLLAHLRRLGFRRRFEPNLSLALGSGEVTLLELVAAYGIFASGGVRAEPLFVTKIVDHEGRTIFEASPRRRRVLAPSTAYQVTSILEDVIRRGTGTRARSLGRIAAGKTGTTNDFYDAWFVGYTPELVAGVWVGYDDRRTLGRKETGGRVAAPIWARFMKEALADTPISDFPVPPDVSLVHVDRRTGRRVLPGSPGAVLEVFRRGSEPPPESLDPRRDEFLEWLLGPVPGRGISTGER
ncbi:MAG: penicillin-binding protein [Candidatus Binatia bacterium]|nr:MAG: penicillin-binding protein [Candidatus Binatia bacterium]